MCRSRRRQVLCVPFEISHQLFHCALALCFWSEDLRRSLLDGELYVWSPRCHEDEFSEGCAKVGVIVTTMDSTRSVLFFTSKPLLVLVISRHKKLTMSPSLRNNNTSVEYRLVFTCSDSRMRCSSCPRDTRGPNHLIVVYVSSRTLKDHKSTGRFPCR